MMALIIIMGHECKRELLGRHGEMERKGHTGLSRSKYITYIYRERHNNETHQTLLEKEGGVGI
jgi:hypothetical protein